MYTPSPAVDAIDQLRDEVRGKGGILAHIKATLLAQARSRVIQAEAQAAQDQRDNDSIELVDARWAEVAHDLGHALSEYEGAQGSMKLTTIWWHKVGKQALAAYRALAGGGPLRAEIERLKDEMLLRDRSKGCDVMGDK